MHAVGLTSPAPIIWNANATMVCFIENSKHCGPPECLGRHNVLMMWVRSVMARGFELGACSVQTSRLGELDTGSAGLLMTWHDYKN
jgi:hypothetical protein